jgi:hypothetical protein
VQRVGGPWAALSIWALTSVPAAFCAYIIRTVFTERWAGTDAAAVVESLPGTVAIWLALTVAFTVWGTAHSWRGPARG